MAIAGIHGRALDITVVGCLNLVDKQWSVRQDSYVSLQYGSSKYRTKTCTDGGINPTFQEKFSFTLIEGVRELRVVVWNSHIVASDGIVGCRSIDLQNVLSLGHEDTTWSLQSSHGGYAGDIRLILNFPKANAFPAAQPQAAQPAILSQLLPYNSSPQPALNHPPVIPGYSTPYAHMMMYSPNPRMHIPFPYPNTPIAGYHHGTWPPAFYPTHHCPPPPQAWPLLLSSTVGLTIGTPVISPYMKKMKVLKSGEF